MTSNLTKCEYRFKVTMDGIPSFLVAKYDETQQPFNPDYASNILRENPQMYNVYDIMVGVYATAEEPMDKIIQTLKNVTSVQVDFLDCEGNVTDTIVRDNLEFKAVGFAFSSDNDHPIVVSAAYTKTEPQPRQMLND